MSAMDVCAIGVGAVCGAVSRYQVGRIATEKLAQSDKWNGWHTAGINIAGSFALGAITAFPISSGTRNSDSSSIVNNPAASKSIRQVIDSNASRFRLNMPVSLARSDMHLTPRTKLMLGVGFCGSFTTFSTYSVDLVNMLHRGETMKAFQYGMANNVGGILAAYAGYAIVKKMFRL